MSDEIIDTIFVRGLQIFGKYHKSNPIEIRINRYKILADLVRYQTLNSTNTSTIFITSIRLNNAYRALINGKLHKTLGVIDLTQIKNWN